MMKELKKYMNNDESAMSIKLRKIHNKFGRVNKVVMFTSSIATIIGLIPALVPLLLRKGCYIVP